MSKVIDIAVVQLPIDLQNEIRAGRGTIASGAFGSRAVEALLLATLLVASAAAAYGLASAVGVLEASFAAPWRWLMLLGGGAVVGVILGEHARLDVRPHGMTSWIVGTTSLVRVERDVIHVYPAEGLVQRGQQLYFGSALLDVWYSLPPQDDITAAIAAAKDPIARASDRWRAAAVGRPAPLWRWTPLLHGAGLGLALAVVVETLVPHATDAWDDLAARTDHAGPAVAERDRAVADREFADAKAKGIPALFELVRDSHDDALSERARVELRHQIDSKLDGASLEELDAWYEAAHKFGVSEPKISVAFGARLARDADKLDADELVSRAARAFAMGAPITALYPRLDDVIAAEIVDDSTDLEPVIRELDWLNAGAGDMPKSYKRAIAVASKQADAAQALWEVARFEKILPDDKLHAYYERAFARELRATTEPDAVDSLDDQAVQAGLEHHAQIVARANELFAIALAKTRAPGDLDGLHVPRILDTDTANAQMLARGKALARVETRPAERFEWVGWLGSDPLGMQIHDQLLELGKHGDLASARALVNKFETDDGGDDIATHLQALCDKAFPDGYRGNDIARYLAALKCQREDNTVTVSGGDDALTARIAKPIVARAGALLGAALTTEQVGYGADLDVEDQRTHLEVSVDTNTFRCANGACILEKDP